MARADELRILQVVPALDAGGAERTTIEVAQAVAAAGGRAVVASRGGRLESELIDVGGEIARLPMQSKNPATIVANAGRLAALARREDLRLLHARSRAPAWSTMLAARAMGLPYVATYHGIYLAKGPIKRFYNSVMARADAVIATSNFTREHVLKEHRINPAKVIAVPRGVDFTQFDPARTDAEKVTALRRFWRVDGDNRAVVLVPARLSRIKGQTTVIEAAAKLESRRPGAAVFILAGDAQGRDDYVALLDQQATAAGVGDIVRRVGHQRDMPTALAAADIGVFPSLVPESFGRAAVEAQAMGLLTIAADLGGQAETVADGETGMLFPAGDAEALAGALERALDLSPEARSAMTEAAKARARALYSTAALQASTLEIYRKLLQDRPRV
ncbi:MAG: glycosyltransferase family 4 protein [Hyphomonadaceae bacterium]